MIRRIRNLLDMASQSSYTNNSEVVVSEYSLIFLVLLVASLLGNFIIGKICKLKYLPEVGASILLGIVVSSVIYVSGVNTTVPYRGVGILSFSSPIFFLGLLPPIVFNSGYNLKRRLLFANMGAIVSLSVIGTTLSAAVVGTGLYILGMVGYSVSLSIMEALAFGSLISATDPVSTLAVFSDLKIDPGLFYLVFGESVQFYTINSYSRQTTY